MLSQNQKLKIYNSECEINGELVYNRHKPDLPACEVCLKFMERIMIYYIKEKTDLKVVESEIDRDIIENGGFSKNSTGKKFLVPDYMITIKPKINANFDVGLIQQ